MLAQRPWAADILHVWFHVLGPQDWFGGGPEVDAMLERRFARAWHALRLRPPSEFLTDPLTARAAVLLFDQVPRNIFRDSPAAFASDPLARAITHDALARGWDKAIGAHEAQFLYMPMMHSEEIADQRLSLALFAALGDPFTFSFARAHHRMIARFGRFPHRNEVLARRSSAAEKAAVAAGNDW